MSLYNRNTEQEHSVYKTVMSSTIKKLELEVNELLKAGFIPQGGIKTVEGQKDSWNNYVIQSGGRIPINFMQAMYKEKKKKIRI